MKLSGIAIMALGICLAGCASAPIDGFSSLQAAVEPLLASACATGAKVALESIPNPHVPNLVDRIETKTCVGTSVRTYISTAASDPSGMPMSLEVTEPSRQLPPYMDIGQSVRPLIAKLGTPSSMTGSNIVYSAPESEDSVTFIVAGGHVVSIRWDWSID
jgi:hypothetical protein